MKLKWLLALLVVSLVIFLIGFGSFKLSKPTKSGLQVITGDEPASIFLNGQYLNKSPLVDKELKPGIYNLSIQPDKENLTSYDTEVTLNPGTITIVTWHPGQTVDKSGGVIYEMKRSDDKNKTLIHFSSIPDKAIIKVDDKPKDFTPLTLEDLPPGQHEYEITLPSYETQSHSLNLESGYEINALIKLAKTNDDNEAKPTPNTEIQTIETDTQNVNEATPTVSDANQKQVTILKTGFMQDGVEVLRVREKANQESKQIGLVEVNHQYPFLSEKAGWYHIHFGTNLEQTGWISAAYAKKDF
jgi:hypothetical protein